MILDAVFFGEVVSDLTIVGNPEPGAPSFLRVPASTEEWIATVSEHAAGSSARCVPGGSLANAAVAFRIASPASGLAFSAATEGVSAPGRLAPFWEGSDASRRDLTQRGIPVLGGTPCPKYAQWPGTLIFTDQAGTVTQVQALQTLAPVVPVLPPSRVLACRSDHLALIDPDRVRQSAVLAVLLADDLSAVERLVETDRREQRTLIFCRRSQLEDFWDRIGGPALPEWEIIATDGPHRVQYHRGAELVEFPVEPLPTVAGDLGAGDAYLGGFLAGVCSQLPIEDCHRSGGRAAHRVLGSRSARPPVPVNLNEVFPKEIERRSDHTEEGLLFDHIRSSPGITLVSGGQTGVQSWAVRAAAAAGLPVHVVAPRGGRQEGGQRNTFGEGLSTRVCFHELGSPSFRYRTWAETFCADAVILIDPNRGEGSAETLAAATYFSRPVLDLSDRDPQPGEVAEWVQKNSVHVVLIAGNRASLFPADRERHSATRRTEGVILGLIEANQRLLRPRNHSGVPDVSGPGAVAARTLEWLAALPRAAPHLAEVSEESLGRAVSASARNVAAALSAGTIAWGVTWPSLLPTALDGPLMVLPLGAFPVRTGWLQSTARPILNRGTQYPHASRGLLPSEAPLPHVTGQAESLIAAGLFDAVFDTYRTGATIRGYPGQEYRPYSWESLTLYAPRMKGTYV